MKNFTKEDLQKAYEAGQAQKDAQWTNDRTSFIGYHDSTADEDFDSWYDENYENKQLNN